VRQRSEILNRFPLCCQRLIYRFQLVAGSELLSEAAYSTARFQAVNLFFSLHPGGGVAGNRNGYQGCESLRKAANYTALHPAVNPLFLPTFLVKKT